MFRLRDFDIVLPCGCEETIECVMDRATVDNDPYRTVPCIDRVDAEGVCGCGTVLDEMVVRALCEAALEQEESDV